MAMVSSDNTRIIVSSIDLEVASRAIEPLRLTLTMQVFL